ncbi:MAG: hypothetical protein A3K19_09635 [Lentisphaerae bacterium RIFOXYB12_FULL_65_16]|nr:MAG: hypothetical protein A3K18_03655 [Lentisphaerae bacterium RIFOXYA12_64_32]OGV90511.1 MAG: hypothetical protein A3K19_09635 [Lentisphaerae bacterium RIFOXYB12_FULL_65_16]
MTNERDKNLRRRAEDKAAAVAAQDIEVPSLAEAKRLVHELRVHQIELEMQNAELRQTRAALETSRTRYFELYDLAPVGYLTLGEPGLILEANLRAAALLGVPRDALVNQPLHRFVLPEDQDVYYLHRKQLFETGAPQACELRLMRQDGRPFWARLEGTMGQDAESGAPVCRVTMSDITEHKTTEERLRQSEKMEAIGQLAGGVAHDFNNQLAGVLGYADMLVDRLEDENLSRYARNIKMAGTRAADLTRQLLAFARKGKYAIVPVNVHRILGEVAELLRRSIDKQIQVRQHLDADPPMVSGDPSQIQNALLNLGLNARDAMPDGGELVFATRILDFADALPGDDQPTGRCLEISVRDSGVGMGPETKRRLFEPFFTTKGPGRGTGMGLASVYGTVRNHGGAIRVRSELGEGTTMLIYLPLLDQPVPDTPETPAVSAAPCHGRVLVVDDEKLVLDLAVDMLTRLGCEVIACADAVEALETYRRSWREIDLVLLDMVMPKMSGKALFEALRAIHPQVKALLASGYSLNGEAQSILDAGVLAFVQKPFTLTDLSGKVTAALGKNG